MIALFVTAALAAEPSQVELAYQKEYAYLRAERDELTARLAEVDADSTTTLAAAEAELDALQSKLVRTTRSADRAEDSFAALDRETASMDDAGVLLATTVQQAADTLDVAQPEDPAAAIPLLFDTAAHTLHDGAATGWTDGEFFLPDGQLVAGRVYTWGRVAAWGTSPAGSGALVPAGEGRMQLHGFGAATATALANDQQPATLDVQLFEAERGVEELPEAGGLRKTLDDAGTMGKLLFGLGLVSAALAIVRAITLLFARRGGMRLVDAVTAHVAADELDQAVALLAKRNSPTARVLGAVLDARDRGRIEQERVVDEAVLAETPRVDRFASALVVITAGAPLLGLLGTVTGMIATFDVITQHGTGNPKLMSAGIAEALVCTALGLSVAIPTLLVGNVLATVGESIKNTLDRGALSLLNALELRARPRLVPEGSVREITRQRSSAP